jgi:demethylmenaquinone methyltransferase/2-methoxy-6-polyprenyl-1,4-benzoquinol methylase
MIEETVTRDQAQEFYDRIGRRYDWFAIYESRAKERALKLLDARPGMQVLDIGTGTGLEHAKINAAVSPGGSAHGIDLSPVMLKLALTRSASPLCRAEAAHLPYPDGCFDRVYSAYVLDLMPLSTITTVLAEIRRVLRLSGRALLLSLSEGVNLPSKLLVEMWKTAYKISPSAMGGCRPVHLRSLVAQAGYHILHHEVIVQLGLPSELVLIATHTKANRQ